MYMDVLSEKQRGPGYLSRYSYVSVRGSNPGEGEVFLILPYRAWGPPNLMYDEFLVTFSGVKRQGRGVNRPSLSSAEVKERVELKLYSLSRLSRSVTGRTLLYCETTLLRKTRGERLLSLLDKT
jgi:hypothetical protein